MRGWLQDRLGALRAAWLIRRYDPWSRLDHLRRVPLRDAQESLRIGIALTNEAVRARQRRG